MIDHAWRFVVHDWNLGCITARLLMGVHNGLLDLAELSDHNRLPENLGARLLSVLNGLRGWAGLCIGCTLNAWLYVHNGTLILNCYNARLLTIVSVRCTIAY